MSASWLGNGVPFPFLEKAMCEKIAKPIHSLDLDEYVEFHDTNVGASAYILRVPGGWIYNFSDRNGGASVFVPYNHEFEENATEYEVHQLK